MRRARRIFLTTCAVVSILAVITGGALYWKRDPIGAWIRNRAVALFLKDIQPELPFKVEHFEIRQGGLKDFLGWKIPDLALVLSQAGWRARLDGPIEIKRTTDTSVTFRPKIMLERIEDPSVSFGPFDSYIALRVHVKGAIRHLEDLADLREAKIRLQLDSKLAWKPLGLEIDSPYLRLDWVAPGAFIPTTDAKFPEAKEGTVGIQARAKAVNWAGPGSASRAASLIEPSLESETPLELKPHQKPPLVVGPNADFALHVKSGEVLWDAAYLNVPWGELPVRGTLHLSGLTPESAELGIGSEKTGVEVSAKLLPPRAVSWKSRGSWELAALSQALLEATAGSTGPLAKLGVLRKIGIRKGTLKTQGTLSFARPEGKANLALEGLDLDFKEQAAAVRGLKLELEADSKLGVKGALEAPEVYFRRAKAKLGRVPFSATPNPRAPSRLFDLKIGDTQNLPIELPNIPFHLGSLAGTLDLKPPKSETDDEDEEGPQYDLITHVEVPPLGIERLGTPFCLSLNKFPPALLSVHFPKLELSNGSIDPTGQLRFDLFEGSITIGEIGISDLFTEVPETDFNLDIKGVRLDQMGNWAGLGEVDGFLEGYAHDVTIQSWLPTHFDFQLQAKPHNSWKIVFSPEAMENFIKLIAEDALDQLPGIAHWFLFGWPATLNKGYDVEYAGISAFSKDGLILLETLDSPEEKAKGNHFILFGTRFKMPLKSTHYPLIVDNSAMSNFVRQRATYLINLAEQKRLEREEAKKKDGLNHETQSESDVDCLPDVLRVRSH